MLLLGNWNLGTKVPCVVEKSPNSGRSLYLLEMPEAVDDFPKPSKTGTRDQDYYEDDRIPICFGRNYNGGVRGSQPPIIFLVNSTFTEFRFRATG